MNCQDFVALCLAKTAGIAPATLENLFNTRLYQKPRAGRFSSRYNFLGGPLRRPLDNKVWPGDLLFLESAKEGLYHVAVLYDIEPELCVMECAGRRLDALCVQTKAVEQRQGVIVTYVPFELAYRAFIAHLEQPGDVTKRLSYDAFVKLLPVPAHKLAAKRHASIAS